MNPTIYKPDKPFCKIEPGELKELKELGKRKEHILRLRVALNNKKYHWWQWVAKIRKRRRSKDFLFQIEGLSDQKQAWWKRMRKKYSFSGPAIVSLARGEIIMGVPRG